MHLEASGELALDLSPAELSQQLISRQALSSEELLAKGGHLDYSIVASRWIRLLVPLAMALMVLPCFVRFQNHNNITVGGVLAILTGLLPILFITMATMTADSSPSTPFFNPIGNGYCLASWYVALPPLAPLVALIFEDNP